jgi:hypothetical protein
MILMKQRLFDQNSYCPMKRIKDGNILEKTILKQIYYNVKENSV